MSLAADTRNMYVEKEKQVLKHTDAMTEARQLVKTFFPGFVVFVLFVTVLKSEICCNFFSYLNAFLLSYLNFMGFSLKESAKIILA